MAPNFERLARPVINAGRSGTGSFERAYRSHFEVSPAVCVQIWLLLEDAGLVVECIPVHLLWALFYLKNYETEEVGAPRWAVSPKTYRKWVWIMTKIYQSFHW